MGNVIIPTFITQPQSSYQIQFQGSVKADVVVRKSVSRPEMIGVLAKHFEDSIEYLQKRKAHIFKANGAN